ncbi:MAG TPA: hypothetical protein VNA20_03080 [Frankiaceae bacterium]|nr:hypothetical protein [Frankiaceae bacterium]
MLGHYVMAVVAAATAVAAPHAAAAEASGECVVVATGTPDGTSTRFDGHLAGLATADGPVSVACRLTRNGTTVAASAPGSGTDRATTYGAVSVLTQSDDELLLCVDVTADAATSTRCERAVRVPPYVVYETVDAFFNQLWAVYTPPFCDYTKMLTGYYGDGAVIVNEQGDVYVNGEPQWECPPYDIQWPEEEDEDEDADEPGVALVGRAGSQL